MAKQHVHMVVDAEVWKLLKIEAAKTGLTMTGLVEKLIKGSLGEEAPVLQDTQMSRGDYRGVNLTPNNPIADTGDELTNSELIKTLAKVRNSKGMTHLPRAKPETTPYQDIKDAYNLAAREFSKHEGLPGFKTCRRLDAVRKRGIKRLLDELKKTKLIPFEYFKLCARNRHWCGDNDRGWRADIEFLTRDKNISAALELEEVDQRPQNGNTENPEIAVENAKTKIRRFLDNPHTSDDLAQFMPIIEHSVPPSRLEDVMGYFQRYSEHVGARQ